MIAGSKYVVQYRRKRKGLTDYKKRLEILKPERHRFVVRPSNKHIITQIINYKEMGDVVIESANSGELRKFGWEFSTSNTPAAYLTGLLCGLKSSSRGVKTAVFDIGLNPSIKGSKIYGALKGAIDSGLEIPHEDAIFPTEDRIRGEHIAGYRNKKEITEKFIEIKERILGKFKNSR